MLSVQELERFIVRAKMATYVGKGQFAAPSRPGAKDLIFEEGHWQYRDSYFGGTDFLGQEVVWLQGEAIWAMNYHGYILRSDLIDGEKAAQTIRPALSQMYASGRFLGGYRWVGPHGVYEDESVGNVERFKGRERILVGDVEGYALDYSGGLIIP